MEVFKIFNKEADLYNQIDTIYQNWNTANNITNKKRNYDTRGKFLKEYLLFLNKDRSSVKEYYTSKNQYHLENERMDNNTITEQSLRGLFKNLHIHYKYIEEFDYSSIPNIDFRKGIFNNFIHSNYNDFLEYFQDDYIDWINKNGYKNASGEDYRLELIKIYKERVDINEKSEWSFIFKDDTFLYNKIIQYLTSFRFNTTKGEQIKNENNLETPPPQKKYLKDLFKDPETDYREVIDSLIKNELVTENKDGLLNFKRPIEDTNLGEKTLICTLAIILERKNHLTPNNNKVDVARALTNTFINFEISGKTYGETLKNYPDKHDYNNVFYFIN